MMVTVSFTYRSVSDTEFEEYVKSLEGPAGRSLSALLSNALLVSLRKASEEVGEQLIAEMKAEKPAAAK